MLRGGWGEGVWGWRVRGTGRGRGGVSRAHCCEFAAVVAASRPFVCEGPNIFCDPLFVAFVRGSDM